MYYYTPPQRIWGVDPRQASLDRCRDACLLGSFARSDDIPRDLPVGSARFDVIVAFSVFTHLSERTARRALETLARYVEQDSICVITIRPREYWPYAPHHVDAAMMQQHHDGSGFAFTPYPGLDPVEDDVTYGDTSMTIDWIRSNITEWRVVACDHVLNDPWQMPVYLKRSS